MKYRASQTNIFEARNFFRVSAETCCLGQGRMVPRRTRTQTLLFISVLRCERILVDAQYLVARPLPNHSNIYVRGEQMKNSVPDLPGHQFIHRGACRREHLRPRAYSISNVLNACKTALGVLPLQSRSLSQNKKAHRERQVKVGPNGNGYRDRGDHPIVCFKIVESGSSGAVKRMSRATRCHRVVLCHDIHCDMLS
jgi:hypothetical protein